ncbi:nuclease-related domain-containing protein [Streptomyces yaizuensis]|uniref:nuclease-related domain-containing protein n=1 Tax=Streptomyces yaizuensis TaxID=2989713 RepID=UPI002B214A23|nr:nuclease-related domain-containing protein [Streptomyces sp. YSPA8]
MDGLRVTAWQRSGHDRLYVNLPDGTSVGWADRRSGQVVCLRPSYRDAVLDALARHTPTAAHSPEAPPPPPRSALPPLTPENDLARRGPSGLVERALRRDPLRTRPPGERRVAAELGRLTRYGWHVLHGIPLPRASDLGHLLIGPGGVFTVDTLHCPGAAVRVDATTATVGAGLPLSCPAESRAGALRVRTALERHCGFPVPVQPVLVFTGVTALTVDPALSDVRVYQDRQISALGSLTGTLAPDRVTHLFTTARDRRAWLDA